MESIIKVDIQNEYDALETYDYSKANRDLLNYIISKAMNIDKYSKIKIVVNKNKLKLDIKSLIRDGFEDEYNKSFNVYEKTNLIQASLFILGFIILVISFIIGESGLLHEILLIIGWVPIWEVVHLELFTDFKERKRRNVLRRLMKSEIEVK